MKYFAILAIAFYGGHRQFDMSSNTGRRNRRSSRGATVSTKSGRTIKINRSMSDRSKAKKAERAAAKAAYLATLPKDRWKRYLYRMHPTRVYHYWFSHEGAIMALKLIGVSYDDFRRHIYPNYHKEVRVVVIDGQHQACDADLNPARCNISITHGVISGVVGYY